MTSTNGPTSLPRSRASCSINHSTMWRPSITTIISVAFLAYMANSLWSLAQLFIAPDCDPALAAPGTCLTSQLAKSPARRILFLSTLKNRPQLDKDLTFLGHLDVSDPAENVEATLEVPLSKKVRNNGTMYVAVFSVPFRESDNPKSNWLSMIGDPEATYSLLPLTQHHVPEAETFNLLGEEKGAGGEEEARKAKKREQNRREQKPVTHLRSKMTVSMMTDPVRMPTSEIPPELYYLMRKSQVFIKVE